jgi:broad specificity phosphatase PhoE
MAIYLIRHGETDWNRQGRLQGLEDIELNSTGVRQAQACARALSGLTISGIVTSPLRRAKVTADIIAAELGLPVIVDAGLTERDFGRLSGLTAAEREALLKTGGDHQEEPLESVIDRMLSVIYAYAGGGNVLMVSHGASINAVLMRASGGAVGTGKTLLKNTCVSKLIVHCGQLEIEYFNKSVDEFLVMDNK